MKTIEIFSVYPNRTEKAKNIFNVTIPFSTNQDGMVANMTSKTKNCSAR
jgi:hypothetical protein